MADTNVTFRLPSGVHATRSTEGGRTTYSIHGLPAVLTDGDVEVLYADSIAGAGGRELRGLCHQCQHAIERGVPVSVVLTHGPYCRNDR